MNNLQKEVKILRFQIREIKVESTKLEENYIIKLLQLDKS